MSTSFGECYSCFEEQPVEDLVRFDGRWWCRTPCREVPPQITPPKELVEGIVLPSVRGPVEFKDVPQGTPFIRFPGWPNEWHERVEGGSERVNLNGTPHKNEACFQKHGPVAVEPWTPCYLLSGEYCE